MCGRLILSNPMDILVRFQVSEVDLTPRYNMAPSQDIPVIINDGSNRLAMYRWGLIPYWAKDISIGNQLINARGETVDEKPSFKYSLPRRRCLVVADGFYEWRKEGSRKYPYRITLKNNELFGLAGLWDTWTSPAGEVIHSCTIITTVANELILPLHDRMPVILSREAESIWLDPNVTDSQLLKSLLTPYPAEQMSVYEVTSRVNSPKFDNPECLVAAVPRLF
ncbi:SOS response-associated peptidase [Desulfitobacterium sp. PCE1]|uniref:SOS response-associated peptidase n=1 Tax=Desulfitobacterium sp. PCE1 TaxID=146907 RepID=UPI000377DCC1|nr:SOS response-associated peptidase [Desulfitobacterium sp. PCE1]